MRLSSLLPSFPVVHLFGFFVLAAVAACAEPRRTVSDGGDPPVTPSRSTDAAAADRPMSGVDAGGGTVDPSGPPATDPGCPDGQHSCEGVCKDSTSPMHCGFACDPCPVITNGTPTCDGTKCGIQCPTGQIPCEDK